MLWSWMLWSRRHLFATLLLESVDVEAVDSEVVVVDVESEVPGELPGV